MPGHPLVDLLHRAQAATHLGLRERDPFGDRLPRAGGPSGGGEVLQILGIDEIDPQRIVIRRPGVGLPRGGVQGAGQRVRTGQVHRLGRRRLQDALGFPQFGVERLGQHRLDAVVGVVAGQLLTPGLEDLEFGDGLLVEALAIHETVRPGADLGLDLRADVGVGGLDRLDVAVRRTVAVGQQQVERLEHRGLADLVGAAHHHHTLVWEGDLAVGHTAEVGEPQAVQDHAALPSLSRNSSPRAARAAPASAPPERAVSTSSATASAANPPMPRSSNSQSAGITAMSVCRSHG